MTQKKKKTKQHKQGEIHLEIADVKLRSFESTMQEMVKHAKQIFQDKNISKYLFQEKIKKQQNGYIA